MAARYRPGHLTRINDILTNLMEAERRTGSGGEFTAFAVGNYCNGQQTCWSPTYAFERFELDFLAVIRGLPFERFEAAAEGEFIMKRTA